MNLSDTGALRRPLLTRNWKGKSERLPDYVEVEPAAPEARQPIAAARLEPGPATPTSPHHERVKPLLDRWAEWMAVGGVLADGAPRECPMAPDARIQSFEDMEIESDKLIVAAVDTCVWELQVVQREAVMRHYGFKSAGAWMANWDAQFGLALDGLFALLKQRIAC